MHHRGGLLIGTQLGVMWAHQISIAPSSSSVRPVFCWLPLFPFASGPTAAKVGYGAKSRQWKQGEAMSNATRIMADSSTSSAVLLLHTLQSAAAYSCKSTSRWRRGVQQIAELLLDWQLDLQFGESSKGARVVFAECQGGHCCWQTHRTQPQTHHCLSLGCWLHWITHSTHTHSHWVSLSLKYATRNGKVVQQLPNW